eukprot:CAMPEP_0185443016 /NCGR_PEP_ID=MMETSP1365-20130426/46255_1 /TAXON_ID=38817 /ORGANISM="Gephyrocapsa oceanica, Strain RCC1303" /LENGTH=109 /DNA_ID=CAMNT_0028048595 /DNA_START=110 /DNA_END=436 /DNA_ORIENTATION=+
MRSRGRHVAAEAVAQAGEQQLARRNDGRGLASLLDKDRRSVLAPQPREERRAKTERRVRARLHPQQRGARLERAGRAAVGKDRHGAGADAPAPADRARTKARPPAQQVR